MSESRVTAQLKKAVAERGNGCCEYCRSQARFAIQPFSIEHIIPRSQGGETTLHNLALAYPYSTLTLTSKPFCVYIANVVSTLPQPVAGGLAKVN